MSAPPVLSALSSRRVAALIRGAQQRVIYAAPGIQLEAAQALAERVGGSRHALTLDYWEVRRRQRMIDSI